MSSQTQAVASESPENSVDAYSHLTDPQWALYNFMSDISEECWCAGWLGGNEYDIWQVLHHGESPLANRHPNPRLLRLCQALSVEIGGWIIWTDSPQFVPMPQWLAMVDERRKLAAAPKA